MVTLTPGAATRRWTGESPLLLLSIAALVFASVCGGLALSDIIGRVSALWIANAFIVFFLLKHPRSEWPAILIAGLGANFSADLFMGDEISTAAALTFCNAIGIVIVATPLEYLGLHEDLSRPKPLCVFYALALGPAPAAAGILSAFYFHSEVWPRFLFTGDRLVRHRRAWIQHRGADADDGSFSTRSKRCSAAIRSS